MRLSGEAEYSVCSEKVIQVPNVALQYSHPGFIGSEEIESGCIGPSVNDNDVMSSREQLVD
jgi:hypothetical protein